MNKYKHLIYTLIIVTLSSFLVVAYHNVNVLEARIDTLKQAIHKDFSIDNLKSEKSFKEDYYIIQQDRDSTLILWIIPIAFTAFGLISFFNIESRLMSYKKETEAKHEEYVKNHSSHNKMILEIKARIDQENAFKSRSYALEFFRDEQYQWYVESMFSSFKYESDYYLWITKENPELRTFIISDTRRNIKRVYNNIKNLDYGLWEDNFRVREDIKDIQRFDDKEINKYLTLIHAILLSTGNQVEPEN